MTNTIHLTLISGLLLCYTTACTAANPKESLSTPPSPETTSTSIKTQGISLVAAYLAELGYFAGDIKHAQLSEVQAALKLLQHDLQVAQTGQLDNLIWQKLQTIRLSGDRKADIAELESINSAMSSATSLQIGEPVFVIEKVDCKSSHEAWVLFYQGRLQQLHHDTMQVNLTHRYALWYDRNYEGISDEHWWCIPKKRFCYSSIEFSDWGGTSKPGDLRSFDKTASISTRFGIIPLITQASQQVCRFATASQQGFSTKKTTTPAPTFTFHRTQSQLVSQHPVLPSLPPWSQQDKIIRIIHSHHYLQPQLIKLENIFSDPDSLNHYLSTLDPYSKYLSAAENTFYQKRNESKQTGLGINILIDNDHLLAVPIQKGPAYQAGLKYPRYLHTVNHKQLSANNFSSFRFLTELPVGSQIPLQVSNSTDFESIETYTVTVAPYQNASIEDLTEADHQLIRIHAFDSRGMTRQLKNFLQQAMKKSQDIIIDLRYCPGGSLYEAIDAASLFLPADLEVSYLTKADHQKLRPLSSLPGKITTDQKIYLWVSSFTASAAEIFARILKHYANATIVGTPTQGKCLSQRQFEFEDGSALQLSVFEILGPDKQPCQGKGIQPDIIIAPDQITNSQYYLEKFEQD